MLLAAKVSCPQASTFRAAILNLPATAATAVFFSSYTLFSQRPKRHETPIVSAEQLPSHSIRRRLRLSKMRLQSPMAWSLAAGLSVAQAQYLVSELSFGYGNRYVWSGNTDDPTNR